MSLEQDPDSTNDTPQQCLYGSILHGIINSVKINSLKKNTTSPLSTGTLKYLLDKSDKSCNTENTNIVPDHLMPEGNESFFTWLDPKYNEKLFWISYENTIKLNNIDDFRKSISENSWWETSHNDLNSRQATMTKQITFYNEIQSTNNNPNITPGIKITASFKGNSEDISTYAFQNDKAVAKDVVADLLADSKETDTVILLLL